MFVLYNPTKKKKKIFFYISNDDKNADHVAQ